MKTPKYVAVVFYAFIFLLSINASAQNNNAIDSLLSDEISVLKKLQTDQVQMKKSTLFRPAYYKMDQHTLEEFIQNTPSFGMFHENYFATGIPLDGNVNQNTSDAKFQISISQRLFKKVLPLQTILMLTYSQKSFWRVYANSSPFSDNNYNPGFTLSKPIIMNGQLRSIALFSIEHESNGRDSTDSRAWNYATLSLVYFLNLQLSMQTKVWVGKLDRINNPDLMKYKGYGLLALNYRTLNDMFRVSFILNPRNKGANTTVELNYRMSKNSNQFLFVQWYNGYAEGLLNYNHFTNMIRFGICMKPAFWNYF